MTDIVDRLNICIESEDGYWPTILAENARDTIIELREQLRFLRALEEAGVDNWQGYDYACEIYRGETS